MKTFSQYLNGLISFLAFNVVRLLCVFTTKLFFRQIEQINPHYIPKQGPVMIYGNHNNQFVDGMLLLALIKRKVSFIAAAVSVRRPVIGALIKGTGAIPVERPQDIARKGPGLISSIRKDKVIGIGTKFTELLPQETLKIPGTIIKVKSVESDTVLIADRELKEENYEGSYKIIPRIEHEQLYEEVWRNLAEGKCIGIFPEGGSHDKLELMPLKAGICIMALGAMQKYGKPVTLIPAGFNYYNPHKFRSKAIIQYGPPYTITQEMLDLYKNDQKKAITTLLENIKDMLKVVTTQCRSFEELSLLFLCRELYTLNVKKKLTTKQKLQLNRRFSQAFDKLYNEPKLSNFFAKLKQFNKFLKTHKLKINSKIQDRSLAQNIFQFMLYLCKCLTRTIAAIPSVILIGPVVSLIRYQTEKERKREEKKMNYEEQAKDIVGSYKILLSLIYFPILTIVHMIILYYGLKSYTNWSSRICFRVIFLIPFLIPFYGLFLAKSYDSLGRNYSKLTNLFKRFFTKSVYEEFKESKEYLSEEIVELVNQFGERVIPDFEGKRIVKREEIPPPRKSSMSSEKSGASRK